MPLRRRGTMQPKPAVVAPGLVGTIGAATLGTSGAAVTPAWGASEARTAGNLLVLWVSVLAITTQPTTPAGWTLVKNFAGTQTHAALYIATATGGDSAPTIASITGGFIAAQLAEFQGMTATVDRTANATSGTTSPRVATAAGADAQLGELVLVCAATKYTANATKALTHTINNGAVQATDNAGTSTSNHYSFGYCFTTSNTVADSDSFAFTTTSISGTALVLASIEHA